MVGKEPVDLLLEAIDLSNVEDPHTEPYKSKYAASELLKTARASCEGVHVATGSGPSPNSLASALLCCQEGEEAGLKGRRGEMRDPRAFPLRIPGAPVPARYP